MTKKIVDLTADTSPDAGFIMEVSDAGNGSFKSTISQIVEAGVNDAFSGTNGSMLILAAGVWTMLPPGEDGDVLTMVSGAPAWVTP